MCLIGDLSHHPVLLLERPRSRFIYGLDPLRAAETRVKILGILSEGENDSLRRSLSMAWHRTHRRREGRISILSGNYEVGFYIVSSFVQRCCQSHAVCSNQLCRMYGDAEV